MFSRLAVILGLATLLVSAASSASAQDASKIFHQKRLSNGLEVIVLPSSTVPLVTVEICVKNGAFTEPPEFNGLSHLYEHMFFKGNAVITDQESYLKRIRELGIVFNGTTSTERVNYYFTLPADNLEAGLTFMRDAITTPKFDPDEFEKEKKVVLGEVDRNESNPYYWFNQAINDRLWYAHPTRKDALGDRKTIIGATVANMKTMQKRYYVPNNSLLVVAGDVNPEQVFKLVEAEFSSWKRGRDPFVKYPIPEHPSLPESKFFVLNKDVQVPLVEYAWHGPKVDVDPRATYAADVLSFILSQPASKFQKNLVESGLTLGASFGYYTQRHTGPISATAQVNPANMDAAIPAILKEIEKMLDPDYFTEEQLKSAKTILAIQDLYAREQMSSFAHTLSFWWATAGTGYFVDYIKNLNSVTHADIARYLKRYVLGKDYVLGVLMNKSTQDTMKFSDEKLRNLAKSAAQPQGAK